MFAPQHALTAEHILNKNWRINIIFCPGNHWILTVDFVVVRKVEIKK